MVADSKRDVLLGLLTAKPVDAVEPRSADVVRDVLDDAAREKMRSQFAQHVVDGGSASPLFVFMAGVTWGLAGTFRCAGGVDMFHGLSTLEGMEEGRDFIGLGADASLGDGDIVLVTQELCMAYLCRMWARVRAYEVVRPLLSEAGGCPFNMGGAKLRLGSDEEIADHYLELMLGRGQKDACPKAEQYLQGVARDMQLNKLPYLSRVLEGRAGIGADDSVLSILKKLESSSCGIPRDVQEDLALAVTAQALELVQVLGLDL